MANLPRYSFLNVKPTSLSQNLCLGAIRHPTDSQVEEITRFVNDIRKTIKVDNLRHLRRRFRTLTPERYQQELDFIARNALGCEPLPDLVAWTPPALVKGNDSAEAQIRMLPIHGADRAQAVATFLEQMQTVTGQDDTLENLQKYIAIATSQFQSLYHNVGDGNGRLSRMLTLIYWPGELTQEMIARSFEGCGETLNMVKSFTDPNVGVSNNSEWYALDLMEQAKTGTLLVPTSWHSIFPENPTAAYLIGLATSGLHPEERSKTIVTLYSQHFETELALTEHGLDYKVGQKRSPTYTEEQIENLSQLSRVLDVQSLLEMGVIGARLFEKAEKGEAIIRSDPSLRPEDLDIVEALKTLADFSRQARLDIIRELVAPLYPEVSVRDILLSVYEMGVDSWLREGIIPERDSLGDIGVEPTWLMPDPASLDTPDIAGINADLQRFYPRSR